jgi:hypothetical protein
MANSLAVSGTDVRFDDLPAVAIQVNLTNVSGRFEGAPAASLAEIEVVGRGAASR